MNCVHSGNIRGKIVFSLMLFLTILLFACADNNMDEENHNNEIDEGLSYNFPEPAPAEDVNQDFSYLYDLSLENILSSPPVEIAIDAIEGDGDYWGTFLFPPDGNQSFSFGGDLAFETDATIYTPESLTIQFSVTNNHINPSVTVKLEIVVPKDRVVEAIQGDWGPYKDKMVVIEIEPRFIARLE